MPVQEQVHAELPSYHRMSAETLTPQGIATVSPVIARTPGACPAAPKFESVSPVSPVKAADSEEEAPVPRPFSARESEYTTTLYNQSFANGRLDFFKNLATTQTDTGLAFRPKMPSVCTSWVVYCNECNNPMEDEHFHCSVCDGGDYDLCPSCVDAGTHCPGKGHWMVKRFVKNGCVVNSTTQRIPPKVKAEAETEAEVEADENQEVPGAFTEDKAAGLYEEVPTRTCNCCVNVLPEKEFVTCVSCDDYDLCLDCHVGNRHGHHPGHVFKAATAETILPTLADFLCNSGRNVRHSAVCDGCDKFIYGVRHKCLHCPDWDYCSDCVQNAQYIHPRHRFVPIYEPLAEPINSGSRHYGIYCDGPLCKDKDNLSYIEGVRFKCAVCHDTDFCQNCEAHPSNKHNHTHPLIKFKTPVRSVSVTTVNDDKTGRTVARLGDRQPAGRSTSTETTPVASSNAATQVQTLVDLKPTEETQVKKEKIAIQDLLVDHVEPVQEPAAIPTLSTTTKLEPASASKSETASQGLDAHFVRDTIVDGSKICSSLQFVQIWTMRNPGPNAWPAGCSVRHVGGDNMLNIDNSRPLSHADLAEASETNILDRSVEAGEEVSFRVIMKAPQREGTAISYWRLKTAEGMPFGHRLWCDIRVVAAPSPSSSQPAPVLEPTLQTVEGNSSVLYERLIRARLERMKISETSQQQLEQQKMERIQRVRKAAVERLLENRRRAHEAALTTREREPSQQQVESAPQVEVLELPGMQKASEAPAEMQHSGMIFPRLDKESPESSTYESSPTVQPQSPVSEKSTVARTVTVTSDDEFFEDAESVALHSDDDGFMTDEEYDILDASDEEMQ